MLIVYVKTHEVAEVRARLLAQMPAKHFVLMPWCTLWRAQ